MSYKHKKHLGQHFLADQSIIDRMIRVMQLKEADKVIEIGPGQGALTHQLIKKCPDLCCVEYDQDLVKYLNVHLPNLKVVHQDALEFDFREYAQGKPLRIIGNLPYNISTPILFHLLEDIDCIHDMHLMLQKEVVDRICAAPHSKAYGRLSIMVQYLCKCENLFDVPDSAFNPPPKVHSAVAHLTPYPEDAFPFERVNIATLNKVVTTAFTQRRKTIRNALKSLFSAQALEALNIDTHIRPENLEVADFVRLAKACDKTTD